MDLRSGSGSSIGKGRTPCGGSSSRRSAIAISASVEELLVVGVLVVVAVVDSTRTLCNGNKSG